MCECDVDFQGSEELEYMFGALYCESSESCNDAINALAETVTDVAENVDCDYSMSYDDCSEVCIAAYESYTGISFSETTTAAVCEYVWVMVVLVPSPLYLAFVLSLVL